jgi:hypothetical protein
MLFENAAASWWLTQLYEKSRVVLVYIAQCRTLWELCADDVTMAVICRYDFHLIILVELLEILAIALAALVPPASGARLYLVKLRLSGDTGQRYY